MFVLVVFFLVGGCFVLFILGFLVFFFKERRTTRRILNLKKANEEKNIFSYLPRFRRCLSDILSLYPAGAHSNCKMFGISTPQWAPCAGPCRIVSSLQVCSRPAFTTCQFTMLSRVASRKVPIQTVLDFILTEKLMQKRTKLKTIVPYKTGPTLSCLARRFEPTTHASTHIYTREAGRQTDKPTDREKGGGDARMTCLVVVVAVVGLMC